VPLASLPGPFSGLWRLGPVTVHWYAVCVVAGILALLWIAERRYRAVGGRPWLIVDLAVLAVPVGLLTARIYRVLIDFHQYFGAGKDWVGVLRIWDGGFGLPGAAVGGVAVISLWCTRRGVATGPVLAAAAPGIAVGAGVSLVGNWFSETLYGPPSTVPWSVPIAPGSRIAGYQDFGTFQPLFAYEALWDVAVGIVLVFLIRRLNLTGDRAVAICAGGYAFGVLSAGSFAVIGAAQESGFIIKQVAAFAVLAGAVAYVYVTRTKLGPEPLTAAPRRTRVAAGGQADPDLSPNASRTAGEAWAAKRSSRSHDNISEPTDISGTSRREAT